MSDKKLQKKARKQRIRKTITTSNKRPRLAVFVSLRNVTAQIIDDVNGKTLATVSSKTIDKKNMTDKAAFVGTEIGKLAKSKKIKKVSTRSKW